MKRWLTCHRTMMGAVILVVLLGTAACRNRDQRPEPGKKYSEAEFWQMVLANPDIKIIDQFLAQYPASSHVPEAKRMLKDLWETEVAKLSPADMEKLTAVIETNRGVIKFKFFPHDAPNTCRNFIRLAKSHFYDGLIFHRVIDGYLIQGGCPLGNGTGNPGYTIPAEFNVLQHLEGTVAMARGAQPDSAGSQFYIILSPQPKLDGRFTVFGQVSEGVDVLHAIAKTPVDANDRPLENQIMKKVYIEGL